MPTFLRSLRLFAFGVACTGVLVGSSACGSSGSSSESDCPSTAASWPIMVTLTNVGSGGFYPDPTKYTVTAKGSSGDTVALQASPESGTTLTFNGKSGSSTTETYDVVVMYGGLTIIGKQLVWSVEGCGFSVTIDRTLN